MKKILIGVSIGALFLLTGCAQRMGEFTVASTQNVSNLKTTEVTQKSHVEGESCIHYITFIPFGNFQNRIQEAMDNAIINGRKKGIDGDILLNTRIYHKSWWLGLYGQNCWIVEGDLVKLEK